jgi:hypothetical protein
MPPSTPLENALHHAEALLKGLRHLEKGSILLDREEHIEGMRSRCKDIRHNLTLMRIDIHQDNE